MRYDEICMYVIAPSSLCNVYITCHLCSMLHVAPTPPSSCQHWKVIHSCSVLLKETSVKLVAPRVDVCWRSQGLRKCSHFSLYQTEADKYANLSQCIGDHACLKIRIHTLKSFIKSVRIFFKLQTCIPNFVCYRTQVHANCICRYSLHC